MQNPDSTKTIIARLSTLLQIDDHLEQNIAAVAPELDVIIPHNRDTWNFDIQYSDHISLASQHA